MMSCTMVLTITQDVSIHWYKIFVKTTNKEETAKAQTKDIMTLGKGWAVDINPDDSAIAETVNAQVVDDTLTVLIDL